MLFRSAEPAPPRRSFVDLTAAPCFSHSPDYRCLTGQVEHARTANEWRLRYASVDEEDRYGGSVTLVNAGPTTEFQYGRLARVEGELVRPDAPGLKPEYRVRTLKLLK